MIGNGKTLASFDDIQNIPKFSGSIYYVSKSGSDTNDGSVLTPLLTIAKALTLVSAGDAINIKAGTFTEDGLDITLDGVELWSEIGATIEATTGNSLTISGDNVRLKGDLLVNSIADATGINITGDRAIIEDIVIIGNASVSGVIVAGDLCDLYNVKVAGIKATGKGFDVTGEKTTLRKCGTAGSTTTIGFCIDGSIGLLEDCFSTGNETSGYCFMSGVENWTIKECTSGAGDGKWTDTDNAQMWDGFHFDEEVYHTTDWSVVGGGAGSDNLFEFTGSVQILGLRADVTTQLHADINNIKFTWWNGTSSTDITDNVDTASAPVGSLFVKEKKSSDALKLYSSASGDIMEEVDIKKAVFGLVAKEGADNYIRATWSGNGNSGALHTHIVWQPITEDGFVIGV